MSCLDKRVQMRSHNICSYAELTKITPIITKYSLLSRALHTVFGQITACPNKCTLWSHLKDMVSSAHMFTDIHVSLCLLVYKCWIFCSSCTHLFQPFYDWVFFFVLFLLHWTLLFSHVILLSHFLAMLCLPLLQDRFFKDRNYMIKWKVFPWDSDC